MRKQRTEEWKTTHTGRESSHATTFWTATMIFYGTHFSCNLERFWLWQYIVALNFVNHTKAIQLGVQTVYMDVFQLLLLSRHSHFLFRFVRLCSLMFKSQRLNQIPLGHFFQRINSFAYVPRTLRETSFSQTAVTISFFLGIQKSVRCFFFVEHVDVPKIFVVHVKCVLLYHSEGFRCI